MKVLLLTNEYPPHVYGGAGVHVEYLSRELARLMDVDVRCFGDQDFGDGRLRVRGAGVDMADWTCPAQLRSVFGALSRCLDFSTEDMGGADIVHCHTWYTHFGGILAKLNYGIPLVVTVHSLEPLRPWKREQLGGGYDFSLWVERTALGLADAVIAVSEGTRRDILANFDVDPGRVHIVHNGIDPDDFKRTESTGRLAEFGVDPLRPTLLFVGRVTRQKGIIHLVRAIPYLDEGVQVVLCAGAPDTPEIAAEMGRAVEDARARHPDVVWIDRMVDKETLVELYSQASVFCCPSVYEPFGIINLEAMACETPVVASAVGGIPEVVEDGRTGVLVPLELDPGQSFEPRDPDGFSRGLAEAVNRVLADPAMGRRLAVAGRARAVEVFSWSAIARQTSALYESLADAGG